MKDNFESALGPDRYGNHEPATTADTSSGVNSQRSDSVDRDRRVSNRHHPVHQLYYTHCAGNSRPSGPGAALPTSSGYGVRSASLPPDQIPECLRAIEPFLQYRLPRSLPFDSRRTLTALTAPPRYVLASAPGWPVVAARVSYRPLDSNGRPGSLFAHVLLSASDPPRFSALDLLRLFAAPGWVLEDHDHWPTTLPELEEPIDLWGTQHPLIGPRPLIEFLASESLSDDGVIPAYWCSRPTVERQALLQRILAAFLEPRWRNIELIADPPFAALLMYGTLLIGRLAGVPLTTSLSTYESEDSRWLPRLFARPLLDPDGPKIRDPRHIRFDAASETVTAATVEGSLPRDAVPSVNSLVGRTWEELLRLLQDQADNRSGQEPSPPIAVPAPRQPAVEIAPPEATASSQVERLRQAIEHNDRKAFVLEFQVRLIRENSPRFETLRDPLAGLTHSEIVNAGLASPGLPRITAAVVPETTKNHFRIHWAWPAPRFVDRCVLGLVDYPPQGELEPDQTTLLQKWGVTRKQYEQGGGAAIVVQEPRAAQAFCLVWSVVDLGFQAFYSPPTVLGRVDSPIARSRFTFTSPGWLNWAFQMFQQAALGPSLPAPPTCPRCQAGNVQWSPGHKAGRCPSCGYLWSHGKAKSRAFISYRREGGSEIARALRAELMRRNVETFLDVDDLRSNYYDERLLREIERAPNFLLILSKGCLDRCEAPDDWLRREIMHAMRCDRNIVPVLTPGFQFPESPVLSNELQDLPRYNCVEYSHSYFGATIDRVFDFLVTR